MNLETELNQRLKRLQQKEITLSRFVNDPSNGKYKLSLKAQQGNLKDTQNEIQECFAALFGIDSWKHKKLVRK